MGRASGARPKSNTRMVSPWSTNAGAMYRFETYFNRARNSASHSNYDVWVQTTSFPRSVRKTVNFDPRGKWMKKWLQSCAAASAALNYVTCWFSFPRSLLSPFSSAYSNRLYSSLMHRVQWFITVTRITRSCSDTWYVRKYEGTHFSENETQVQSTPRSAHMYTSWCGCAPQPHMGTVIYRRCFRYGLDMS